MTLINHDDDFTSAGMNAEDAPFSILVAVVYDTDANEFYSIPVESILRDNPVDTDFGEDEETSEVDTQGHC